MHIWYKIYRICTLMTSVINHLIQLRLISYYLLKKSCVKCKIQNQNNIDYMKIVYNSYNWCLAIINQSKTDLFLPIKIYKSLIKDKKLNISFLTRFCYIKTLMKWWKIIMHFNVDSGQKKNDTPEKLAQLFSSYF